MKTKSRSTNKSQMLMPGRSGYRVKRVAVSGSHHDASNEAYQSLPTDRWQSVLHYDWRLPVSEKQGWSTTAAAQRPCGMGLGVMRCALLCRLPHLHRPRIDEPPRIDHLAEGPKRWNNSSGRAATASRSVRIELRRRRSWRNHNFSALRRHLYLMNRPGGSCDTASVPLGCRGLGRAA